MGSLKCTSINSIEELSITRGLTVDQGGIIRRFSPTQHSFVEYLYGPGHAYQLITSGCHI